MDFDANMIVILLQESHQTVYKGSRVSDNCPNPVMLVAIERVLNPFCREIVVLIAVGGVLELNNSVWLFFCPCEECLLSCDC